MTIIGTIKNALGAIINPATKEDQDTANGYLSDLASTVGTNVHTITPELETVSKGHLSSNNSTQTPLGINGTFTGVWEDTLDYSEIIVSIFANQPSVTNGLIIEWSSDGVTVHGDDVFTISASSGKTFSFPCQNRYVRVRYTNDGVAQTVFDLQTLLKRFASKGSSHRLTDNLNMEDDAIVTKSMIAGFTTAGGSSIVNVKVSPSGAVQVGGTLDGISSEVDVHSMSTDLVVNSHGVIHGQSARIVNIMGSRDNGWENTTALGDACQYLDTSQSKMNVPTVGQTLYIVSSNANDTLAGTGVRTVRVVYLDSSGNEQTTTVNMNGTTPVSLGTGFTAIQWMEATAVGSNETSVGNISLSSTNGVATVATTFEYIKSGGNKSLSGRYKIPNGYTGYIMQYSVAAINNTMDCRLRADVRTDDGRTLQSGVFIFQDRVFLGAGANSNNDLRYLKYPALSTIKISAIPGAAAAGNKLDCSFLLLLLQN